MPRIPPRVGVCGLGQLALCLALVACAGRRLPPSAGSWGAPAAAGVHPENATPPCPRAAGAGAPVGVGRLVAAPRTSRARRKAAALARTAVALAGAAWFSGAEAYAGQDPRASLPPRGQDASLHAASLELDLGPGDHAGELVADLVRQGQRLARQVFAKPKTDEAVEVEVLPPDRDPVPARFQNLRFVGAGNDASVYIATDTETGGQVAIKSIRWQTAKDLKKAMKEMTVLKTLGGGDIVKMLSLQPIVRRISDIPSKGREMFAVIVMEAADGTLFDRVISEHVVRIPETMKLRMFVEILRGLCKLNEGGYAHRDVKPENILVFGDCHSEEGCHVKLADFGYARELKDMRSGTREVMDIVGSPAYMAPEVWAGKGDARKSDVWSAGMLAAELFAGSLPMDMRNDDALQQYNTLSAHPVRELVVSKGFDVMEDLNFRRFAAGDKELGRLIRSMLSKRVWRRPTIQRCLASAMRIARSRGVSVPEQPEVFFDLAVAG